MFDASDRHAATEVFDPEILVESYPIVDNAYTRSIPFSSPPVGPFAPLGRHARRAAVRQLA